MVNKNVLVGTLLKYDLNVAKVAQELNITRQGVYWLMKHNDVEIVKTLKY